MNKILIFFLLTMNLLTAKAQNKEVEIYLLQSNAIVKGAIEEDSGDSLHVKVDSLHTLAFAKSELEGLDLPVSGEVKKLQKNIFRSETTRLYPNYPGYPGIYQMRNGKSKIGKVMFWLFTTGIVCVVIGGIAFILSTSVLLSSTITMTFSVSSLWGSVFTCSLYSLIYGFLSSSTSFFWNGIDRYIQIQSKIKNRYYYTGENLKLNNSF